MAEVRRWIGKYFLVFLMLEVGGWGKEEEMVLRREIGKSNMILVLTSTDAARALPSIKTFQLSYAAPKKPLSRFP